MIDSQPDLAPLIRRVRGGYLKIQGTWMPYEVRSCHPRTPTPRIITDCYLFDLGCSQTVTKVVHSFIDIRIITDRYLE